MATNVKIHGGPYGVIICAVKDGKRRYEWWARYVDKYGAMASFEVQKLKPDVIQVWISTMSERPWQDRSDDPLDDVGQHLIAWSRPADRLLD